MSQSRQINQNNGGAAFTGSNVAVQGNATVNELSQRLNVWVQAPGNSQNANITRAEFLRAAEQTTNTTLNLHDLQLTSLPDVFDLLPRLTSTP